MRFVCFVASFRFSCFFFSVVAWPGQSEAALLAQSKACQTDGYGDVDVDVDVDVVGTVAAAKPKKTKLPIDTRIETRQLLLLSLTLPLSHSLRRWAVG